VRSLGDNIDKDANGYVDDVNGWNFVSNDSDPTDEEGDSTHVPGTFAALHDGSGATSIVYDASIMAVRVLDEFGRDESWWAQPFVSCLLSPSIYPAERRVGRRGFRKHKGLLPILRVKFSADLPNGLAVGALIEASQLTYFGNKVGNSGTVQIDGPSEDVFSTMMGDTFGELYGTSMATGPAAGVAALLLSAYSGLTSIQVRIALTVGVSQSIVGLDSIGALNALWRFPLDRPSPRLLLPVSTQDYVRRLMVRPPPEQLC